MDFSILIKFKATTELLLRISSICFFLEAWGDRQAHCAVTSLLPLPPFPTVRIFNLLPNAAFGIPKLIKNIATYLSLSLSLSPIALSLSLSHAMRQAGEIFLKII